MKRRCFVVSGEAWARIYVLMEQQDGRGRRWARLQALLDNGAVRDTVRAARAGEAGAGKGGAGKAGPGKPGIGKDAGDDLRRFAGSVIQAAGAAMRATGAEELVLVAPPVVLAGLRAYKGVLARHGIQTTCVPMAIELLVPNTEQPLLDGAVGRGFAFASAAEALTRAA
jgi:hypothetical protein